MTYSVVARDPASGALGVAVQSCFFAVGAVVPWARPGVGAVATQAFADPAYGHRCLDALAAGVVGGRGLVQRLGGRSGGVPAPGRRRRRRRQCRRPHRHRLHRPRRPPHR
jgi:hypothetical protein